MMLKSTANPAQMNILGVAVHDVSARAAVAQILSAIERKQFLPVGFLNAHIANVAVADPPFRETMKRFMVLADGIGVDIGAKLLYGHAFTENLNGTDFVPFLIRNADRALKIGLWGARPGVAEKAAGKFRLMNGAHDIRVISHGYAGAGEQEAALDAMKAWQPDILLVAMGVPMQENWIAATLTEDHCRVPMAVGALFDLTTGTVPRAPAFLRAIRCEWVYRLMQEPGRMWRRYLLGNPLFLFHVLRQKLSGNAAFNQTEPAE